MKETKLMKGRITMRTSAMTTMNGSIWTKACINGRLGSVRPDYTHISIIALVIDLDEENKPETFMTGRLCRGNPARIL